MDFETFHRERYSILGVLKFNVLLMGLYENFSSLPDIIGESKIINYELEKVYFKLRSDVRNSTYIEHVMEKDNRNAVYGAVNYEMIRSIFYDNGVRNNDFMEVFYEYGYLKSCFSSKEFDTNVRYYDLYKDEGNTLYLRNNDKNVYINLIGRAITNVFSNIKDLSIRERILNNNFEDSFGHLLYYFSYYDDCKKELVKMIERNIDIIGSTLHQSCAKFMKYYSKVNNIDQITLDDYKKANAMIIDLCNMIEKVYLYGTIHGLYCSRVPVVLKSDSSIIHRSICFEFTDDISDIRRHYDPDFDVGIYNINQEKIYIKEIFYKIISNKIIIPIKFLENCSAHYIDIKIGGKNTGVVLVSEYFLKKK